MSILSNAGHLPIGSPSRIVTAGVPARQRRGAIDVPRRDDYISAMAEPQPTIRYIEQSGSRCWRSAAPGPSSACAGWPTRLKRPAARRAAAGRAKRWMRATSSGSIRRARIEILQLADAAAGDRGQDDRRKSRRPVQGRAGEHVRRSRPRPEHVNWLVHWLDEVGHESGRSLQARSSICAPSSARSSWSSSRPASIPNASASTPWCARCTRSGSRRSRSWVFSAS